MAVLLTILTLAILILGVGLGYVLFVTMERLWQVSAIEDTDRAAALRCLTCDEPLTLATCPVCGTSSPSERA